jgi:hypothetical protein
MFRALPAFLLAALAGCSSSPHAVAEFGPGDAPEATAAPRDGTYLLYRADGQSEAAGKPHEQLLAQVTVERGAPVGFGQGEGGRVIAVAGERHLPMEPGLYRWEAAPEATWAQRVMDRVFGDDVVPGGETVGRILTKDGVLCVIALALAPVALALSPALAVVWLVRRCQEGSGG